MNKLMDIFANWRKGKKEHDEKVKYSSEYMDAELIQALRDRAARDREKVKTISCINPLIESLKIYRLEDDKELEAKHWQILAEYAQDQVKSLMIEDKPQFNVSATIDGATLNTIIQRAEKRHGFGINT